MLKPARLVQGMNIVAISKLETELFNRKKSDSGFSVLKCVKFYMLLFGFKIIKCCFR